MTHKLTQAGFGVDPPDKCIRRCVEFREQSVGTQGRPVDLGRCLRVDRVDEVG